MFQEFREEIDQHFDIMDQHFDRMNQHFDKMMQVPQRDCRNEALLGQQACTEDEDAYDEESGRPDDDFTVDGGIGVTPFEIN